MSKELTDVELIVGHYYRGKRFKELFDVNNDRIILYISPDGQQVQYDSDTVRIGQQRPLVDADKFLRWAKEDVTHLYKKEKPNE